MRLSDALKQKRADLLDRLEKMNQTATDEGREFTADESRAWDSAQAEVRDLDQRIAREEQREDLRRKARDGRALPLLLNERGEPITILRNTDKLFDRHRGVASELADQFGVRHAAD